MKIRNKSVESPLGLLSYRTYSNSNSDFYNNSVPQVFWVNQLNELIAENSTGRSKTQKDYQYLWQVNYDSSLRRGKLGTQTSKISENIGNDFTKTLSLQIPFVTNNTLTVSNTNSITDILSSEEYNIGYSDKSILSFIGNNNSLLDVTKWIDKKVSIASTTKLLSTIHPQINDLDKIVETNVDKVRTLNGGEQNDIDVPINIYFKMNSMDPTQEGLNFKYINLNSSTTTVKHIKKLRFYMETEEAKRPFIFTLKFILNRSRVVSKKTLLSSSTQLTSNR